jgi:hypothetical protein
VTASTGTIGVFQQSKQDRLTVSWEKFQRAIWLHASAPRRSRCDIRRMLARLFPGVPLLTKAYSPRQAHCPLPSPGEPVQPDAKRAFERPLLRSQCRLWRPGSPRLSNHDHHRLRLRVPCRWAGQGMVMPATLVPVPRDGHASYGSAGAKVTRIPLGNAGGQSWYCTATRGSCSSPTDVEASYTLLRSPCS